MCASVGYVCVHLWARRKKKLPRKNDTGSQTNFTRDFGVWHMQFKAVFASDGELRQHQPSRTGLGEAG